MKDFSPAAYWESRLAATWNLHGVGYRGLGEPYNEWMYRLQTAVFSREVAPLRRDWSRAKVIDIGSGTGHYVNLWRSLGAESVVATDLTNVAVGNLRRRFPGITAHVADIGGDLPGELLASPCDVVSAFAVLFHIVDDRRYARAFENVYRLLKPGGLFVLSENFLHGATLRSEAFVSRTLAEIEAIAASSGFRIIKRVPLFVLMNAPVDTSGVLAQRVWAAATYPVRRVKALGAVAGALLYPVDFALTKVLREGPSTELMVCERLA
jgi:SAM-dependent methyltransferase